MEDLSCNEIASINDIESTVNEIDNYINSVDKVIPELDEPNGSLTESDLIEPDATVCKTQESTAPPDSASNTDIQDSSLAIASSFPDNVSENIEPPESIIEVVEEITVASEEPGSPFPISTHSDTEDSQPAKEPVLKSRKGPLPGLLPLDQNSPVSDSQETRTPRKAALKSAEKIKVMAKVELPSSKTYSKKEVAVFQGPKGISDNGGASVTVYKTDDPNYELCRGCNKMEPCTFQTTGRKGKDDLSFCSKKCVQGFFKFGGVHYVGPRENLKGKESNASRLQDSFQDHFVIEPDIEIQTLSDEFQMEFEDSESSSVANGASKAISVSSFELIEKAAKETLCCSSCSVSLYNRTDTLLWESMEFCSEKCLRTYVKVIGSHCNMCNSQVGEHNLGKLCVRFGTVIRQFCTSDCLEKFKSSHKLCGQCQVNMSDKEKVYCSAACEELSRRLQNKEDFFGKRVCAVCNEVKTIREEVYLTGQSNWLCSKPCRNAFRFANKVTTLSCGVCSRYFDVNVSPRFVSRNIDKGLLTHTTLNWCCSNVCFATHLLNKRKIENCARCQVKKYNVDMIRKPTGDIVNTKGQMEAQMVYFCSIFCYTHYLTPPSREPARKRMIEVVPPPTTVTTTIASSIATSVSQSSIGSINVLPVPSNPIGLQIPVAPRPVMVLNQSVGTQLPAPVNTSTPVSTMYNGQPQANTSIIPIEVSHKIVFVPPKPKEMKNKAVWCRPSFLDSPNSVDQKIEENSHIDETNVNESEAHKSKEEEKERKPLYIPIPIPIPVPIYVPVPMAMYNFPTPFPLGFPVPVATPVLFPVDQVLVAKMLKSIQESKEKLIVATTSMEHLPLKEQSVQESNHTESENSDGTAEEEDLKQADNELDNSSNTSEDAINFELELPSCTIALFKNVGRKRSHSTSRVPSPLPKRLRESDSGSSSDSEGSIKTSRSDSPSLHVSDGFKKEIGVKAWKSWMQRKNDNKQLVKQKLNEMNVQEMNSSLISFANEIRKPDGTIYRPDILLYFIYGLQQSFGVDRRRQNLLMDMALLPFQLELDKHLQPFYDSLLKGIHTDSSLEMATCLKESHLWECQQLGVDSPIVLVFTMLYFNTKYFRLYTAEQHEQMAFTNVHKIQKKIVQASSSSDMSNGSGGKSAAKIFSLQYQPTTQQQQGTQSPQPTWLRSVLIGLKLINDSDTEAISNFKFKKPMEIPQNIERPSHCPIKHFNFYLSKCPESMKTRRDMFYLLPEVSSTPESLVWYSTQPVPREILARMLRRVLLIEEVLNNLCSSD